MLNCVSSPLQVDENVALAPFTTFGIGGPARYFITVQSEEEIAEGVRFAAERMLPLFVLGGGSNLLVKDTGFAGVVLHIAIKGIDRGADGLLDVGAGESWETLVDYTITEALAGIECLAGIPGYVGGTPVQNVGAYGQEVSQTIESVRAFDRYTATFVELANPECRFRYRESVFNKDAQGRYIVTRVRFRLQPQGALTLRYAELQRRFPGNCLPTLAEVAAAVRDIRRSKGMVILAGDPDTRSAGSFFKNPVVPQARLQALAARTGVPARDIPHWPVSEEDTKLPAAWLLEKAGFTKGYSEGAAAISSRHTLALTNRDGATCADILRLQDNIVDTVEARFGIHLEREPVLLG